MDATVVIMKRKTTEEIEAKRREIETELEEHLRETGSDFKLEDVKRAIYEEEDSGDFTALISMFDTGQGAIELNTIIETLTDAWNYFPHKALGGLSPAEKALG